ncbi:long-chain fatty acid--CoA ligase [Paenibacillus sp. SC116]|uniref:long-chain-fatty-acid--CoA ligase n=1 Tax=Paenibacillus sp. SC116 TaxID=2968986 RepID=UPI002810D1FC|nr:long-chain fatty acid--CoA ligase [Paenibacillus sp. SC116]
MVSRPWLQHYPSEVASSYEYPRINAGHMLVHATETNPDQYACSFMGYNLTYKKLLSSAYQFANGLSQLGVSKGERVAIMLPNCPQMMIAYFGTLLYGAIAVMTNPLYKEGELTHQLNDAEASVLVTLDLFMERVSRVRDKTSLRTIIVASIAEYLLFPKNVLYPLKMKKDGQSTVVPAGDDIYRFKRWLRTCSSTPVLAEVDAQEDVAILQYTGGTTGVAKGVMLTHYNLVANTVQNSRWFYRAKRGEEVFMAALPCFHVFGLTVLLHQSVYNAGRLILLPRFDVKQVLQHIEKYKVTIFPGAPAMYNAIVHDTNHSSYQLHSIRACVSGASPLPHEVQEKFERITGGRLIEGYGSTETSPVSHANNIWGYRKIGSIGIPYPNTDAIIVHPETGEQLDVGEIGEVVVRGPQVMKGYWKRPEDTAAVLKEGWFYTGDLGKMDEEGFFYIVDRKKDMINASGFKVYPREVEEVLYEHPSIKEAVVIGVPDAYRGETVKAFVILDEKATDVDEDAIKQWCRDRIAVFKVPRIVEFRTQLPKTMVGKVLRRQLVAEEAARKQPRDDSNPSQDEET